LNWKERTPKIKNAGDIDNAWADEPRRPVQSNSSGRARRTEEAKAFLPKGGGAGLPSHPGVETAGSAWDLFGCESDSYNPFGTQICLCLCHVVITNREIDHVMSS
jgi:hypothetical protein